MKITKVQTGLPHADRPLLTMSTVRVGRKVLAITGSTKTKNWEIRPGVVVDIREESIGETGKFMIVTAEVKLDQGGSVITHRLKSTHGA